MATDIELIFCGGGNRRFYEIATGHGFLYGAQLPDTVYGPLYFADQNWKKPNKDAYLQAIEKHKPIMASILDWEQEDQLPEVLTWAEEAAQFVEVVVIIPKVIGGIERLPRQIGGKPVRLGYSVKTNYGQTPNGIDEFGDWPVHLLGGSPHAQMRLAGLDPDQARCSAQQVSFFASHLNVVSADGNMHLGMATSYNQFWVPGTARYASNRWWPTLKEANGGKMWGDGRKTADAPYEAFKRSCQNIIKAWRDYEKS